MLKKLKEHFSEMLMEIKRGIGCYLNQIEIIDSYDIVKEGLYEFILYVMNINKNDLSEKVILMNDWLDINYTYEEVNNNCLDSSYLKNVIPQHLLFLLYFDKFFNGNKRMFDPIFKIYYEIGYDFCKINDSNDLRDLNSYKNFIDKILKNTENLYKMDISKDDLSNKIRELYDEFGQQNIFIRFRGMELPMRENLINEETQNQNSYIVDNNKNLELNECLNELNSYIGLRQVKNEVNKLVNLISIRNIRKEQGLKNPPMSFHLCFLGNPGTGKTTVARIIANIYKTLGILSKGHLIEVARNDLVGGYVGQTAIKTKNVIKRAIGGVLFIDEAYSLSNKGSDNDYGQEAIEVLLKEMEDNRNDLVVIVAGYNDLMNEFIKSNPGLESRFNTFIYFDDYTPNELLEIIESMCLKNDYVIDDDARVKLIEYLENICKNKTEDFANARFARNLFEGAIKKQATRLIGLSFNNDYKTLIFNDFMNK